MQRRLGQTLLAVASLIPASQLTVQLLQLLLLLLRGITQLLLGWPVPVLLFVYLVALLS